MSAFFKEHKVLVGLVVLSFAVLIVGLFMLQQPTHQNNDSSQKNTMQSENDKIVEKMNSIADMAEQELKQQQAPLPTAVIPDIKPQASIDHVAALNGRIPEVGTEDWCEVMMVKDANKWTAEEQSLFAKHCL